MTELLRKASEDWPSFVPKLEAPCTIAKMEEFKEQMELKMSDTPKTKKSKKIKCTPNPTPANVPTASKPPLSMSTSSTSTPSDPTPKKSVWDRVQKLASQRIPLSEISAFPAVRSLTNVDNFECIRPLRADQVALHSDNLVKNGYLIHMKVVLCTPGPSGFKYGIIDGQHRIQALKDLVKDPSRPRGSALSSLSESGVPEIPAYVLEDATPQDVVELSLHYNAMYRHGTSGTPYYWMNMCVKSFDWSGFQSTRLYNSIRWGSSFGVQESPAESCLAKLREFNVDTSPMESTGEKFKKTFRMAARLKFLGLDQDLEGKLTDPFNKKDTANFKTWQHCLEVLCI
ncbi:hypothetical protein DYB28_008032 [Aphanomyces astaci]|uniref:Uncharacterized protein n=1 Tax=Aphanomyces astaci TaxID=112090 RepID=A0A9X8DVQ4_APHAT|nr:hypothetical protein DYB28_008032 [Aphanomyces astaci]